MVIPILNISRKNTLPNLLITSVIVKLLLCFSSISDLTISSRFFPSFSPGSVDSNFSTLSFPTSSILEFPYCNNIHGCCTCIENKLSLINFILSLPSLFELEVTILFLSSKKLY